MRRRHDRSAAGRRWLLAALLLAAAPAASGRDGPPGPEPAPTPTPTPAAAPQDAAARTRPSRGWTSTASPCSTWATRRKQNDPNWFDVRAADQAAGLRGPVRRGRPLLRRRAPEPPRRARASCPPSVGELKTIFEFELFGTGVDAGQTTFRLRHAWGELGQFGAGQTWSPFMDLDVFPNSIEYWGPNGMVFFRNVQVRWTPLQNGDSNFTVALERPGASADQGVYADRIELAGRQGALPAARPLGALPHGAATGATSRSPASCAQIKWDDLNDDQFDLSGERHRLGLQPQLEPQARKHVVRGSRSSTARASQNYMNDAPVDVGIQNNLANPRDAGRGQGAAGPRHRRVPRPQLERRSGRARSATRCVDIDNSDGAGGRRLQEGPVRARQPPLLPGAERVPRARDPVGQARELPGRLQRRTTSGSSSRSSTTSSSQLGGK